MAKKAGTNIVRLVLTGVLEGVTKVFRGHKFVEGVLVVCCDDNRLAAMLNTFRGRLPVGEPERLNPVEGLEAYKAYCLAAQMGMDVRAVHNLGKVQDQVELKKLTEEPDDDDKDDKVVVDDESDDNNDVTDSDSDDSTEDEGEGDDGDAESDPETEELNGVLVDPEVARENLLRATLGQLDHDNPDHWTSTNLPKIEVLEELLDGDVSRKELNKLFPDFKRNH